MYWIMRIPSSVLVKTKLSNSGVCAVQEMAMEGSSPNVLTLNISSADIDCPFVISHVVLILRLVNLLNRDKYIQTAVNGVLTK